MNGFIAPKFSRDALEPRPDVCDSDASFFWGLQDELSTFDLTEVDENVTISMIRLSDQKKTLHKRQTSMAKSFKHELKRAGPLVILERNPNKDFTSPQHSPDRSLCTEEDLQKTFSIRCRSASPKEYRPRDHQRIPQGPIRPRRTQNLPDCDDFSGIVGYKKDESFENDENWSNGSDDEDLVFYKEKYSKLLQASGSEKRDFEDDDTHILRNFNFIPSFNL